MNLHEFAPIYASLRKSSPVWYGLDWFDVLARYFWFGLVLFRYHMICLFWCPRENPRDLSSPRADWDTLGFSMVWYCMAWYSPWVLSRSTTTQNMKVLAQKLTELWLFEKNPFFAKNIFKRPKIRVYSLGGSSTHFHFQGDQPTLLF